MKAKYLLIVTLGMVLIAQTLHAQVKSEDISKIIEQARIKFELPAVAVTILNSDGIYLSEIQGVGIYGRDNTVSSENYFHIGSCSKSILAVIAAKLIEENKIRWDTYFFDIYPEMKDSALSDYQNITLEDLLQCKAGIKEYTSGEEIFPELNINSQNKRYDFAKWLIQQPSVSKLKAGKFQFNYSNASYTMASLMLEKVSVKTYKQLIEKYIIDEMGIETIVGFPNRLNKEQPWGHLISKNGIEVFSPDHSYRLPELIIPAGDLSMKPNGFARYIQLSLIGLQGKDNFIKSESYKYVHNSNTGFSLGVFNSKMFGYNYSGMDGSAGTFFSRAILIPESDFAFTIMTNAGSGTARMKAVDWITMKILKKNYNWWWKFWM